MNFDASTIAAATGGRVLREGPAGPVATDSRTLRPGQWFVALVGDRFDGHGFLDAAASAGAAGCVVDRDPGPGWRAGVVLVADTTRALQALGSWARDRCRAPVVGLTGSSGKTTTRTLVALALSPLGPVHQTVGNLNNHLGVPLTLVAAPADPGALVVEMGTSAPGEIAFLAQLARPTVRMVINVGPAHLQELGGLDGVAREKGSLITTGRPGDIAVRNLDDPRVAGIAVPAGVRDVGWGTTSGDVRLVSAALDAEALATDATFATPEGVVRARLPVPGTHIAHDAAGALAVAWSLGVSLKAAAAALEGYQPVGMRLRRQDLPGGVIALNDAYNANPASMAASLRLLASLPGRKVAVLGDMLELGPGEGAYHDEIAGLAGRLGLDLVVLVGPRMSAAAGSVEASPVLAFPDPLDAVEDLRSWLAPGDRVLFKGSRGARVERILQALEAREARADARADVNRDASGGA